MKIWLDDDPIDNKGKRHRTAPEGFTHVHNLAELKELLEKTNDPIEVMSFDHDLGDWAEDGTELDGYYIIKWLAKNHLDRYPADVRVHSGNPIGAENIRTYDKNVRKHLLDN
ncbi:MAG: cyclic-phosphate processing receiver domain-containing protein [Candidatus Spechtbacterales bacterium]|nr:cyclic-phosphate processing receiver domain-containing protein [Candidatus Spechtbacterales bacterium]